MGVEYGRKAVFSMANEDEGYGLAWSVVNEGKLLSGSCLGELNLIVPSNKGGSSFKRHTKFKTPRHSIEDIAWYLRLAGRTNLLRIWKTFFCDLFACQK